MPETYIARSSAIAARMLAGEMMIMNSADSTFFTLNEVATVIWQAAVPGGDQNRLVARGVAGGADHRQAGPDLGVPVQQLEAGVLEVEPVIQRG